MTKEEIREKLKAGTPTRLEVYAMMDSLGLTYRRTSCRKCIKDYISIISEEVGLIESAADNSGWDDEAEYEYLKDRDYSWQGHRLNQETPRWVIRRFFASDPTKAGQYFRAVTKEENKDNIDITENETEPSEILSEN